MTYNAFSGTLNPTQSSMLYTQLYVGRVCVLYTQLYVGRGAGQLPHRRG